MQGQDYNSKSQQELVQEAQKRGITVPDGADKRQLVEALEQNDRIGTGGKA